MSDDGGEDIEAFDVEGGGSEGGPYTETEHEGLGDRLQGACAGICIGLLLFFGSFPLLFWNEDRAVERYDALNEAESQVASVSGLDIDPANDGQLLHFSVNITNGGDALVDPVFGIESADGLRLRRYAEMYQWVERVETTTSKKTGGGKTTKKTYTYEKEWRDHLINSQNFKKTSSDRTNPTYMEFGYESIEADPILIGAYELPQQLVGKIDWHKQMSVDVDNITDQNIRSRAVETSIGFYFGNFSSPHIGDQRVSFTETPAAIITIVGVQNGNTLSAFVSETGEGGDILLFKEGNYTATAMFEEAEAENAFMTWIIRLLGFVAMSAGLYLVFRPIEVFSDIIPCVGSIVGCGIIFMSVFISAVLSAITISIAWLVAHPEIGAIVLAVTLTVVGCCAFGVKKLREKMDGGDNDDDNFPSETSAGKVQAGSVPTVYANSAPTVYASAEPAVYASTPPEVYAMPEGKVVSGTTKPTVYVP